MSEGTISFVGQQQNPYARVTDIAARLGVTPNVAGPATVTVSGRNGEAYDLFEIIERLLDRFDTALANVPREAKQVTD